MHEAPFWDKLDAGALREAMRALPDGLIILDGAGSPLFINQEAAALLGLSPGQLSCAPLLSKLLTCDVASCTAPATRQLMLHDTLYSVFIVPLQVNGSSHAAAIFFRSQAALQEAENMKSDFIAIASHELRNPLTSIKNALTVLRTLVPEDNTPQGEKFIRIAERNAERIDALITQYLDLARIEAGTMTFEPAELDFVDFAAGVVRECGERAQQKSIRLHTDLAQGLPRVLADPRKLEQILFNLIGNALKFTPAGGTITLAAEAVSARDAGGNKRPVLRIAVTDTGCGIPEGKRGLVFEKFYREPAAAEQGREGAGLGLAIVKRLVALHGGDVHVEGNMPAGSRFVFTLPVSAGERRDHAFRLLFDRAFERARRQHTALTLLVVQVDETAAAGGSAGPTAEDVFAAVREAIGASLFRQSDTFAQRTASGMFVVFCGAETEGARSIHRRIREALALSLQRRFGTQLRGLSVRSGCATYPAEAGTRHDLLQLAEARATEALQGSKDGTQN